MKYIYLIISMTLLSLGAWAQGYTTHSFGYMGGQSNAGNSQDSIQVTFSGGSVMAPGQFQTILQDRVQVLAGFPAMVSYFPRVFDDQLFISKGYFSDYVQLQWNIVGQQDRIERIKVFRKPLGSAGDSTLVASLAADNFTYRDEYAEKGQLYSYTIFAEGIADELRIPNINIMEGVGFAFPFGTASGRVTYAGGTAVEGVQILAETDGNLGGKAIELNGTDAYLVVEHSSDHDELLLDAGFSVQLWNQYSGTGKGILFSKGSQYELSYEADNLSFRVGSEIVNLAYTPPADAYFHVTAVYDTASGLTMYVQENDNHFETASLSTSISLAEDIDPIYFGRDESGTDFYQGYLDEIRVWNTPLTEEEAKGNFSRYLTGSEEGLAGYWKLNSGIGEGFYDFSRIGFEFNENHGELKRATWSEEIPGKSQLAYRGVTDAQGNFVVRGFPYETSGSQYTFTPLFDVHEFEPTQQLRFVGDGSSIFNGLDFDDVSSFPVSGTIRYRHSSFPTEGVSILIDGNPAIDQEGGLITTDNLGQFTVDVPIGFHSLRASKNGHVFEGEGRFPPQTEDDVIPTFDYQQPLAGLEFIDSTVVKFVGKVVGGPIEAEKSRGFGLSVNNIGTSQILITTEKGFDITTADSTATYNAIPGFEQRDVNSSTDFSTKFITVIPDPATGEFVTYLLPEKHVVTGVTAGSYTFGNEHHVSINLETSFEQTDTYEEIIFATIDGNDVPGYDPIDSTQYDYFSSEVIQDTTFITGGKNFHYEKDKDFILRVQPDIDVVNKDGLELFGESSYTYEDELRTDEIELINGSNQYTFGHPVFFQQSRYNMFVSVFEEYTNVDNGLVDQVPVKDGSIEIVNDFAINSSVEVLTLDDKGKAKYTFSAGLPELNKNNTDGTLSFTRPFSLTAVTGENGAIRTAWSESTPLRAIVFGGVPEGNNFVTTGPNQIITILRDPPGSNSRAYLEQGMSSTSTTTWGSNSTETSSANLKLSLGAKITTWAGIGAGIINSIEIKADLDLGLELATEHTSSGETVNTITTTKSWSSSEDPSFVSAPGDVFVGHSTNIVYGSARSIQPIPITDEECLSGDCDGLQNGDFQLGPRSGLRLNPEFGTMFIFTQNHIENVLIPNLTEIRNSILSYSATPGSVVATTDLIYLSSVPANDERFGSANYSIAHWGNDATTDVGVGPSYDILIPASIDPSTVSDTIAYYNKQIDGWIRTLEQNERVKVNAQLSENISFDGGTSFSSSETVESAATYSYDFSVGITESIASSIGISAAGLGAEVNMSRSSKMGSSQGGGSSTSNTTTYGYSLADGDNSGSTADFYSIDVKTPEDGFGPVFVTRAGVTSCPFEGEAKTKYFEPDQHVLNFATVQVEKPEITIVNPSVANVPSNREAEITIELKNNSENGADVFYNLTVDDQSNFNGAVLSIDGSVLTGDGRGFLVPAGTTVSKILKVAKGSDDVNEYENILLKLSSQCDGNISDEQSFSVFFQPGCSDIHLTSPIDQWVVNVNTVPVKTNTVLFDDYDLQNSQFKYAKFQYKATSSSQWLTNMIFYNPLLVTQPEFDALDEPKAWLDETGSTSYAWDMSSISDRAYDVQVVSVCEISPGVTAETPSEVHTGTKDTKRPVIFGAPQPADGILSANDEILIQFDEPIEAGLLTPFNFSVQGVLNSAEISHNASVNFDGVDDYVKIPDGLNLNNRSFTIEFWIKRQDFATEQIVYSKGYTANDVFEFGFTAGNNFFVNTGGQITTSTASYTDPGWNHFAIVYSAGSEDISVYMNDQYAIDAADITNDFTGEGSIAIGKSQITNDRFLNGNIHDFRIWTKSRQLGDVFARMSQTLTGAEVGLVGYWPMDEAYGNKAFDLSRSRHAILFTDWEVSPAGKAYAFDGVDDHLEINTGSTVIVTPEMDYTIEFWFKGTPAQTNTVMFSSGLGDGTDEYNDPANSLSIGFDASGSLYYLNNGEQMTVNDVDYLDDDWHHFAFTLLRQSNANILVDGVQKATLSSSNFGGLSGATMWIGARGHIENIADKIIDQHFDGVMDDFRVWNLGKKSNQINLSRNTRLNGDELGLIGYYPFEFYETVSGVKILNTTIVDQWENPFGANAGAATSFGGATYSDDTPNIKDARPVDKVDFDWAVNGDKIIITTSPTFTSLIEQTILEITLQNVEDLYENRLASPVTWTAFIDRNQLKWDTEEIIAKKDIYEPFTFEVDVVNHGGTESTFAIENLPLWLSASPSSGVLSPVSSSTVTFTVDEGLNTGYYLEDIYLSSDFGYDEKLTIDLQVTSPEPEWNTNPFDFQFSMNLVAQLEIGDLLSSDLNDRVAAFVNDTIRGDVNLTYLEDLDLYEVFLDIYSNVESGETVELRVWDANKGVEYRNALPSITFASNTIIGTPTAPETIIAGTQVVQNVTLQEGWNWSSFNVTSGSLTDINSLMDGVQSQTGDQIKGIDKFDIYTEGFGWSGTLSSNGGLENGPMYLFKMSNASNLNVIGSKADPVTEVNISNGWNWLGFIPRFNMSLNEAFAFFNPTSGDVIKSQFAFAVYDANLGWIGSLKNLEPGKGYLFNSAGTGTFTYPESSSLSGRVEENIISDFKNMDRHKYPNTMTIIAEIEDDVEGKYALAAFSKTEMRGVMESMEMEDGKQVYFMTIHGYSSLDEITLQAIEISTGEVLPLQQSISFSENQQTGTLQSPLLLTGLNQVTGLSLELEGVTLFPNPFIDVLEVHIPTSLENTPIITLTDLTGKVLSQVEVKPNANGWVAKIDGSQTPLKAGIYLVTVQTHNESKSFTVIKNN